jgi:hypothetical protein
MNGKVVAHAWERRSGRLLWTRTAQNLEVYAGTDCVAHLIGGDGVGDGGVPISVVGFGSGTAVAATTDTGITSPAYYRDVDSFAYVAAGSSPAQVQIAWSVNMGATPDYGAFGMTFSELSLWCNGASVPMPVSVGSTTLGSWQAGHAYSVGDTIIDSNSNVQECSTAGTSDSTAPTWATTVSDTTADNTATWTCRATHTAPSIMFARALMSVGTVSNGIGHSGTWTITI